MTPAQLLAFLDRLVAEGLTLSLMIWGPPGIGKSSVVRQVAQKHGLPEPIDLRLSQLAPTDLRGLPVPENGVSRWWPPEFLPREEVHGPRGILFLDELNMAPPAVQGIAQQLILDRRVGSYEVPKGWFIWAAGNRKEDAASVYAMPAPLANRFLHLHVRPDLEAFTQYAVQNGFHRDILAFLRFRPELLHRLSREDPAWPSPRSWEMASRLHEKGLPIAPAVGPGAAGEFEAFLRVLNQVPDLEAVLQGKDPRPPKELSARYAAVVGLGQRASEAEEVVRAGQWLIRHKFSDELLYLFAFIVLERLSQEVWLEAVQKSPDLSQFSQRYFQYTQENVGWGSLW
jgi:MoxR-like ATPase